MKNKFKIGLISVKQQDSFPPSSLVYIGTYLKKYLGDDIEISLIDQNFDDAKKIIKSEKFDLIGMSAMSIHYGQALRLAREIKKEVSTPIVIGGVHISTLPDSFEDCFDVGVIGEGEEPMLEITRLCLEQSFKKENLSNVSGLVFLDGKKLARTADRPFIDNLDSLPMLDWGLVNKEYFSNCALNTWGEFGVEGNILTSRGCPYKCVFCSTTQFWKKLRFHSAEYVLEQVKNLVDNYKVSHIQIWDDLFTVNQPRLIEFASLLKKNGLLKRVKFNCQPRPNLLNDELCEILKSINVKIAIFGFETGSEKVLKYLKYGTVTVEENKKVILLCKKHRIKVQGSVVLGSPGETLEDMQKTLDFVDFAIKNKVQRLWSFVLTPFPGTEIWKIAKERGKVSDKGFDWDLLSPQNIQRPLLLDDGISLDDFQKVFIKIHKRIVRFRWMKAISFAINNPFKTLAYILSNPLRSGRLLFTKKDV